MAFFFPLLTVIILAMAFDGVACFNGFFPALSSKICSADSCLRNTPQSMISELNVRSSRKYGTKLRSNYEDDKENGDIQKKGMKEMVETLLQQLFPTGAFEPQIQNGYILVADLLIIATLIFAKEISAITEDPTFPGWAAPVSANPEHLLNSLSSGSVLGLCWILGCLLNNAYTFDCTLDYRKAFNVSVQSWITFSNFFVIQAFAVNFIAQTPVDLSEIISSMASMLLTMMIWRIFFAMRAGGAL